MKTVSQELTKEYLMSLEGLQMELKRSMTGPSYSGTRKSNAKGSSMEFSDFRQYRSGDDLRRVDWNSFARFDKLFLKLFMEEKQANIHIFLDISASMAADEEKCFYSKMMAASLAYLTLKNTDRFHLFACGTKIEEKKTKIQSKHSFPDVVDFLDHLQYQSETKLSRAIKEVGKEGLGSGISIVISDFFSEDGYKDAVKALQYWNQNVILVQILSKEEKNPEAGGSLRLTDSETKEYLDLELTEASLMEYQKALSIFENEMKEFCYKRGVKFVGLSAETSFLKGVYEII